MSEPGRMGGGLGGTLRSLRRWTSRVLVEPEYPLVAVEVRPRAVAAVRLVSDKKRHRGRQRWVLPMGVGRTEEADDISEAELDLAIAHIQGATAGSAAG